MSEAEAARLKRVWETPPLLSTEQLQAVYVCERCQTSLGRVYDSPEWDTPRILCADCVPYPQFVRTMVLLGILSVGALALGVIAWQVGL